MNNNIFRKKSIERVTAPEQLTDYIRVTNPGVWMVLLAIVALLIGICVWGVFGRMDTKLSVSAISEDGAITCYVKEADIESVKDTMKVVVDNEEHGIKSISEQPIAVDESFGDYLMHVGNLQQDEWVYKVTLEGTAKDGVYPAQIIINSVSPMYFISN